MSFVKFLIESFDTHYNIKSTETFENVVFYYVDIDDKHYRVFIETLNDEGVHLHVGFEFYNSGYTVNGIFNTLSTAEILGLFGTIYYIIKKQKFNSISVKTLDNKKYGLYTRILGKLAKELNFNDYATNDDWISISSDKQYAPKQFTYKSKG